MLVTNLQFVEDELEMGSVTINNFPSDSLKEITLGTIHELFKYKYYLNAVYDHITIEGNEYIITRKTKKAVILLHVNKEDK